MHAEPRPQAAVGCPACPFLQLSPNAIVAPRCCATSSLQPLSRRYTAAYCLTDRHASCGHFPGGAPAEAGAGGVQTVLTTRRDVYSPQQTAGAMLAMVTSLVTVVRGWCARLRRPAPATPQPLTTLTDMHRPVAASAMQPLRTASAARPSPAGSTLVTAEDGPSAGLGPWRAHASRPPTQTGTQDASKAVLAPAGARPRDGEASSRVDARLVLADRRTGSRESATVFALRAGAVVGRWPGSEILIPDPYTSSEHAYVLVREGRWWVDDLGSTNGTFVNGARIDRPTPLNDGDEVRFGRVCTRFIVEPSAHQPRRPGPATLPAAVSSAEHAAGEIELGSAPSNRGSGLRLNE